MKRTILVGVMVLGTSFCSQSFGFDLLDRMLGLKGSGCDSTCCDTVVCDVAPCSVGCEPTCGLEAPCAAPCGPVCEPACGCEAPCEPTCGLEAPCGSVCEPACGCEIASCSPRRKGLLDKLFGGKSCCDSGCDVACAPSCEPACGVEVSSCCDVPSCTPKRGGLLAKLFSGRRGKSCCDTISSCGSGCNSCGSSPIMTPAPTVAPMIDEAPEVQSMPPAPEADHNAYLNSKRRVIQASNRYSR